MRTEQHPNPWAKPLVGLLGTLIVLGCGSKLIIKTVPEQTRILVKDPAGNKMAEGPAPLEVSVSYSDKVNRYILDVTPEADLSNRYHSGHRELTAEQYRQLPGNDQGRTLEFKLDHRNYEQLKVVRLILDPLSGWVGQAVEERAFRDVGEQGGAVPTRVIDLDDDAAISGMAISPDGQRIVFSSTRFAAKDLKELKELRLDEHRELPIKGSNIQGVRITGGGVQHITNEDFNDLFPAFTGDGKHLLFCSNRRRPSSTDILRTGADGRGGITNIYIDQRNARAVKPTQANDGTIAFALYPEGWSKPGDAQIWTVGGATQFPTQIALGIQPAISPDGKQIVYVGVDGNLWVVNVDGSNATQLAVGADRIPGRLKQSLSGVELAQFEYYEKKQSLLRFYQPYSFPSWSPDGKWILFSSMEGNDPTGRPGDDIWLMALDGSSKQQLTTNGSVDRFPLMSPDGNHIYFYSNRGLKWAIWRISSPVKVQTASISSISPAPVSVVSGATVLFHAMVTGAWDKSVLWSASAGSMNASSGQWEVPLVHTATPVTISASANADSGQKSTLIVVVNPSVKIGSITPAPGTVEAGSTTQFSAAVSGSLDGSVTWSATSGTIDPQTGIWIAPLVPVVTTLTITVMANADNSKKTSINISVNPLSNNHLNP